MTALNGDYDALNDNPNTEAFDEWVEGAVPEPVNRRWCPTHRRWEINPPGRLLCGPAWAELYRMEREEAEGSMGTNQILTQMKESIDDLVYVIDRRRSVIAEPPTKPQIPTPPTEPSPLRGRQGRGGVAL